MKKHLIFIVILIIIILFLIFPKEKNASIPYNFYKINFKDRYDNYSNINPNLSLKDVIIRVNLNLDNEFYTNTKESKYLNSNKILVNKYNYLTNYYVPDNLTLLTKCTSKENYLVLDAKNNFDKMCEDIKSIGLHLRVISSYRSYSYQENLYNNYVKKDGIKKADTYSARPGYSEHQTGLSIDVDNNKLNYNDFELTKEYEWLINNSYKYGFILRYPVGKSDITGYDYESWHFRYVGLDIAKYIYENSITFDEYYAMFLDN